MINRNNVIYFFLGMICFSALSTYLSKQIGIPFGVPEVFLVFFLPFLRKKVENIWEDFVKRLFPGLIVFFGLLSVAMLTNNNELGGVFATSRAYLYLILFFCYGLSLSQDSNKGADLDFLFFVSLGSTLGGYINGLLVSSNVDDEINSYGNLVCLALLICLPLIQKRTGLFLICLTLTLYVAFSSGLRRQIVEIGIALGGSVIFLLLRDKFSLSRLQILLFITLPTLLSMFIGYIERYFFENNYYLWTRIFLKTERLQRTGIESEGSRGRHFDYLLDYIDYTWYPRGIYPRGKSFSVGGGGGSTLDFPLYELFHTFGSVFAICMLIFLLFRLMRATFWVFLNSKSQRVNEVIVICVVNIVLISCLFFDGSFLQFTFVAPLTGFFVARLLSIKL